MRRVLTFLLGLAVVAAILAAGVYFFRAPIAGAVLSSYLSKAGVQNPSLTIDDVSLSRLRISGLKAGADRANPAVSIDRVDVDYDLAHLFRGSVTSVAVGPGSIAIAVDDNGKMRIAGAPIVLQSSQPQAVLPFDRLRFDGLALIVDAPEGSANGGLDGAFSMTDGGDLTLAGKSAGLRIGAWTARDASLAASLALAADGAFKADAKIDGDFSTAQVEAKGASVGVAAAGRSWRDAVSGKLGTLAGFGRVTLQIREIPIASAPWLAPLRAPTAADATPIKAFGVAGEIGVDFAQGRLVIDGVDGAPVRITADRGDTLVLSGLDGASLYERNGPEQRLSLLAALAGQALTGRAQLAARSETAGAWTFEAASELSDHSIGAVSLGRTTLAAAGEKRAGVIEADLSLVSMIENAAAGAFLISNAPLQAALHATIDLDGKSLAASTADGRCVAVERLDFKIDRQDSDGRLTDARLCRAEGPVLTASWSDSPRADIMGDLVAREGRYRIAKTRFQGEPPRISFAAAYESASKTTTAQGTLAGGRVLMNNAIMAAGADGAFVGRFDAAGLDLETRLDAVRLSQNVETTQVAPVVAAGMAGLKDEQFRFSFAAKTPAGLPLGLGEGAHDVRTGRGDLIFRTGPINFAPRGIQPANVVPALKGIIGPADGAIEGEAAFAWGPAAADIKSSGDFSFRGVSFIGPGRAISKTEGVTGRLVLSGLGPLKSAGAQTLSIRLIDLDALQLEDGTAHFELPGDDTLRIIDAEFPWFGGKIGAYDTVATLTGESATTALRASGVDLGQMLGYLNVEGLSGEGVIEGVLPIKFSEGRARIENGELSSIGPGVVRFKGEFADAASEGSKEAKLAFDILRELHFSKLAAEINGPLDGTLKFKIIFEGLNEVNVNEQRVTSPVIYRIAIEAPLLALIDQARLTTDLKFQFERVRSRAADER